MSINSFDAVVYTVLVLAILAGFQAGFLRSMATILGYVAAMPIAMKAARLVAPALAASSAAPWAEGSFAFIAVFVVAGTVLGALMRLGVSAIAGPSAGILDRLVGALFGAIRVGLIAVAVVLVFDRLIPTGREPAFLTESRLRPFLSIAGQQGLNALPPDIAAYIDQLKQERRL